MEQFFFFQYFSNFITCKLKATGVEIILYVGTKDYVVVVKQYSDINTKKKNK